MFNNAIRGFTDRVEMGHREAAWQTWHSAALANAKRMPSLKEFVSPSKAQAPVSPDAVLAMFQGLKAKGVKVDIRRVEIGPGPDQPASADVAGPKQSSRE